MIQVVKGDILEAEVEALVNPVNCVGVMGKGLAKQMKMAFPENFQVYKDACSRDELVLGRVFVAGMDPYIINFPTKYHWRDRSHLAAVRNGLTDMVSQIRNLGIQSVALPPLGCGLGGLRWEDVCPLILEAVSELSDVTTLIYEPVSL